MKKTNRFKLSFIILVALNFLSVNAHAELDKYDQEALQKTQEFLRSKSQREANLKTNKDAQPYVQKMNEMGMNAAQQDQTFNITADVFGELIKANNGDPAALQKMLLNAQKDPQGFFNSLSPEQKSKIQNLGKEMEAAMSSSSPK